MTEADVRTAVWELVGRMATNSSSELLGSIAPLEGLGLDSEDGIEFAEVVSERLGIDIPVALNPFKNDEAQTARTLDEIVTLLISLPRKDQRNG